MTRRAGDTINVSLTGEGVNIVGGPFTLGGGGDGYYYSRITLGDIPSGDYILVATRNGEEVASLSLERQASALTEASLRRAARALIASSTHRCAAAAVTSAWSYGGATSTTSIAASSTDETTCRTARSSSRVSMPPGSGRAGPRRQPGIDDVDVDRQVDHLRPVEGLGDGIGDDRLAAALLDLGHEVPAHALLAHPVQRLGPGQ